MVLMTVCIVYTSDLMILAATKLAQKDTERVKSYAELCKKTLGNVGDYVLAAMTFLIMFGAMCVYAVLLKVMLGEIISDIMGELFKYDTYVFIGAFVVFTLPLCVFRVFCFYWCFLFF